MKIEKMMILVFFLLFAAVTIENDINHTKLVQLSNDILGLNSLISSQQAEIEDLHYQLSQCQMLYTHK
jgi:cell division protein FtsL